MNLPGRLTIHSKQIGKKTPAEPNKPQQEPAWNQQEGIQKSYQNRVRDGPWCLQNASGTHPEHTRATEMQKNGLRSQKGNLKFFQGAVLGRFWDPAGTPKSTKNGPGAEKVRPEAAPKAIFSIFSRRCRSESLSEPIFEGSDPQNVARSPY